MNDLTQGFLSIFIIVVVWSLNYVRDALQAYTRKTNLEADYWELVLADVERLRPSIGPPTPPATPTAPPAPKGLYSD